MITLYTDGACLNNPGPGGWGVLIIQANQMNIELSGGELFTTNNQMELEAALQALLWLKAHAPSEPAIIYTDSMYVQQGITTWIHNWKKNNWRTATRAIVKNDSLWKKLDAAQTQLNVQWKWVKAHNGHPLNEYVDQLARTQAQKFQGISHASH
jgi:ribonuclease HI